MDKAIEELRRIVLGEPAPVVPTETVTRLPARIKYFDSTVGTLPRTYVWQCAKCPYETHSRLEIKAHIETHKV